MTRLFTIHINRVDRCRSGGEKSGPGYTRSGPLHPACNAYAVTAMCHSRRAQPGLKRASWIFIRGYCKINVSAEKPAAKEQQKETRNRVIPGHVYVSPPELLQVYRACARTISTGGLKFHPIHPLRLSMTTTAVVGPARFPESSDIYFRRPETPAPLLGLGNPVRFHTSSVFVWKIWPQW